jgi:hypothetical protein
MTFLVLNLLFAVMVEDAFVPFPSGFQRIQSDGCSSITVQDQGGFYSVAPDHPMLPLISRIYILPGRAIVEDAACELHFESGETILDAPLGGASPLQPISRRSRHESLPALVGVSGESPLVAVRTGHILNTLTVVSVSVNPWRYAAGSRALSLASSARVSFQWHQHSAGPPLSRAQELALNHRLSYLESAGTSFALPVQNSFLSDIDYLIITGEETAGQMHLLETVLENRSLTWETLTVEEIDGSWGGTDTQEDIRNCIRHYALERGTAFVLLAGDENLVPARQVYMECEGHIEMAPCDLYYADLDGTWDNNGNGIYGEYADSLDLYADVILGRLLFSSSHEAEAVLAKNVEYAAASRDDWFRRAVICGAQLFPEIGYTGEKGCEMIAPLFPGGFELVKAYELGIGDYPDTYFEAIYEGSGWNHYAGHGNERGVYWGDFSGIMSVWRMNGFHNQGQYGIHSSIGCHVGDFTSPGTGLADTLLTLAGGGGVACLFNTTWGWEGYWPEVGPSERLVMNTVGQVFVGRASSLGLAHTVAKDLEIPLMTGPYDRVMQSVMAYSLFGDPSLAVLGVSSHDPVPPPAFSLVWLGGNPVSAAESPSFKVTGVSNNYRIGVFDITGRQVLPAFDLPMNRQHALDTTGLVPGVYFVSARAPGGTSVSRSFVLLR